MALQEDDRDYLIPDWAYGKWAETRQSIKNVSKSIVKVNRAVITLKNHKTVGTYPNSIAVTIKVQVDKEHQNTMNQKVKDATTAFQNTILDAMIESRSQELEDRKKDLDDIKSKFLDFFSRTLRDLREQGIVEKNDEECRILTAEVKDTTNHTAQKIGKELQLQDYFIDKEKQEKREARQAVVEERRVNETLTDPAVKELQDKVNSLEKKIQDSKEKPKAKNAAKPKAAAKKGKNAPKGKGPPQARANGSKKGQGKGNQKPKPRSTGSTNPSGSKK